MLQIKTYTEQVLSLLKKMISTPSFSREEKEVADLIERFLQQQGIETYRLLNNVFAKNKYFKRDRSLDSFSLERNNA